MSYARSWLCVPGNRSDFLETATTRGADALIIDLEDSIPPAGKQAARATVAAWLPERPLPATELWLRLNPGSAESDLQLVTAGLAGVVVPKAAPGLLGQVDEILTSRVARNWPRFGCRWSWRRRPRESPRRSVERRQISAT